MKKHWMSCLLVLLIIMLLPAPASALELGLTSSTSRTLTSGQGSTSYSPFGSVSRTYVWSCSDTSVVSISPDGQTCRVQSMSVGTAVVSVSVSLSYYTYDSRLDMLQSRYETRSGGAWTITVVDDRPSPTSGTGGGGGSGGGSTPAPLSGRAGDIAWNFNESTWVLTLTNVSGGSGIIPDYTYSNLPPWNAHMSRIKGVELGEGIVRIGDCALYKATSLKDVSFAGSSLKTIGDHAFYGCDALNEILLPEGLTTLESNAFSYCDALTTVQLPDSLTTIGAAAFRNCEVLTDINLPKNLKTIGDQAFWCCRALAEIQFPDRLTHIGDSAFAGCDALTTISLPNALSYLGERSFEDCYALTAVQFADGLTTIGASAFAGCNALTTVQFADGLTTIGTSAFEDCEALTSVQLPDGLTTIGDSAFYSCGALKDIQFPDSLTSIGSSAFYNCDALTAVQLPHRLTTLGMHAFTNCNKLSASIVIPDSVTNDFWWYYISEGTLHIIGRGKMTDYTASKPAPWSETSINKLIVGEGITHIGNYAFYDRGLSEIQLPSSLTSIGNYAFYDCGGGGIKNLQFPNRLNSIGSYAFYKCPIVRLQFPDSLETISDSAFLDCTYLEEVQFPSNLTYIGKRAFQGCSKLAAVKLPYGLTYLGNDAFTGCNSLSELIDVPDSVTNNSMSWYLPGSGKVLCIIGHGSTPDYSGYWDSPPWHNLYVCQYDKVTQVDVGKGITTLGKYIFEDMTSLRYIRLSGTVTTATSTGAPESPTRAWFFCYDEDLYNSLDRAGYNVTLESRPFSSYGWVHVPGSLSCTVHKTAQIDATISPDPGAEPVTWSSSAPEIVTVDETGTLTPLQPGTAVITLKVGNVSASTTVTVHQPTVDAVQPCTAQSNGSVSQIYCICGEVLHEAVTISNRRLVTLPPQLEALEAQVLMGSSMQQVVIPDGVTSIPSQAFANCGQLCLVVIPASVTSIADDAFSGYQYLVLYGPENSIVREFARTHGFLFYAE